MIRILIADDHGVLRAGLRSLLQSQAELEVVGEASDGRRAVEMAMELRPDIVLMDISMPGLGGIEAARQLARDCPETRVLMLTVHEDNGLAREAIRAGAAGYVSKRAVETELLHAIQSAARGELYVYPSLTRSLITDLGPANSAENQGAGESAAGRPARPQSSQKTPNGSASSSQSIEHVLTGREVQVLQLIVQGHTNRQIADRLKLSIRTVESHRANLMDKLDRHSRVELVRYAAEHGLLK